MQRAAINDRPASFAFAAILFQSVAQSIHPLEGNNMNDSDEAQKVG